MLLKFIRPVLFAFLLQFPVMLHAQGFSQNISAPLSFYLEIAGNSDSYSINADYIVYRHGNWKSGLRAGVGTNLFFMKEEPGVYPIVPVEIYTMVGKTRNHLELGLGYTHRFTDAPDLLKHMYFGRIGFRYQVPRGGLLFRFGLTPFVSPEGRDEKTGALALIPRFGISIGKSF